MLALAIAAFLIAPAPTLWLPPLGQELRISEHDDLANGPYAAGHRGIDLPATGPRRVVAPTHGTVTFSGTVVDRPLLSIRVGDDTVLTLEPIESDLKPGDVVARGQPVGTLASGGHCANECLHLGVRIHGEYTNPLRYFRGRPVLLPW